MDRRHGEGTHTEKEHKQKGDTLTIRDTNKGNIKGKWIIRVGIILTLLKRDPIRRHTEKYVGHIRKGDIYGKQTSGNTHGKGINMEKIFFTKRKYGNRI